MTPMEALRYISSPTMGLPAGREAEEFVRSKDVDPENARYALEICIRMAKKAIEDMEQALEEVQGKSVSELISEYAEALTFPDDLPGGAELSALELRAVYRDGSTKTVARQTEFEGLEEGAEVKVEFNLVVTAPDDEDPQDWFRKISQGPLNPGGQIGLNQSGPWGVAVTSPTHFEQYRAYYGYDPAQAKNVSAQGLNQDMAIRIDAHTSHMMDALLYQQEALKAIKENLSEKRSTK